MTLINYKKIKPACTLCDTFMCMQLDNGKIIMRCIEYSGGFIVANEIKKCSKFSLRYNLRDDLTKKEVKEIKTHFKLVPEEL